MVNSAHASRYPSTIFRVSVKAVIRNTANEIIVNKELGSTTWSLPGGGLDHGETDMEALARELSEEVGYDGEFTAKPIATKTFWVESKQTWLLWIVYEVITENDNFSKGGDSTEVAFISPLQFEYSKNRAERWIYENLR